MSLLDQIDDDLTNVFFNTDDFAKAAIWTPSGGSAADIVVIFDDEYTGTNLGTGELDTASPQVRIKSSTVTSITPGDSIVVDSTTYYVLSVQPDGTGVTLVTLSKKQVNNG
jgi:hypothetical protein